MPNLPNSTFILKCVSDRKEGRTQEPRVKSSTNAQEGLQNLDDSTRFVAPQVCRSKEPQVKLGLQHAATGLFRSQPVQPYSDRLLKSDPHNWQMEGGQTRKYEDASFLENVFETENPGVR